MLFPGGSVYQKNGPGFMSDLIKMTEEGSVTVERGPPLGADLRKHCMVVGIVLFSNLHPLYV